jgi:type I restriction enzyme S subunit
LAYYLIALRASGFLEAHCNVVSMPHLTVEKLGALPIPVPLGDQQRAIADYLDRETTRIDALIEEQERLIDLLRERRSAVIALAFADSGSNSRIQHACVDVIDCPHTTPVIDDEGGYEAVRTSSVRGGIYRSGKGHRVSEVTWRDRNAAGAPEFGDILFTREAPAGEACMVPSGRVCLGQRMVLLKVDRTACNGRFLLWQLYSPKVQDHFTLSMNGSTVGNIRLPVLRGTPIWLPPLDVQRRIVAYLDEQTAKIDTLIAETERFIELAKERRAALITAAVTGQLDVPARSA